MDVGHTNGWRLDEVVSAAEIISILDAELVSYTHLTLPTSDAV